MQIQCNHEHDYSNLSFYGNYDPTRTTTLRTAFARRLKAKYTELGRLVRDAVSKADVFALDDRPSVLVEVPQYGAFDYTSDQAKIQAFLAWLEEKQYELIFAGADTSFIASLGPSQRFWFDKYILQAYEKGTEQGLSNVVLYAGIAAAVIPEARNALLGPFGMNVVGNLYSRVREELMAVNADMTRDMSRVLSQGFIEGTTKDALGRSLNKVITDKGGNLPLVDNLGRRMSSARRSQIIARTEIVRAHHIANMEVMKHYAISGVSVMAEWITAGDARVCPQCAGLAGSIWTIEEITPMIPVHPLCRCVAVPVKSGI